MADQHDHPESDSNCEQALAELYTFLDGELTEERRALIGSHLDDCNPCLEVFDFEAELRMVIKQRCREEVPEELRVRIEAKLRSVTFDPE
jgi:mycothiol system anti-sigma-R factor